MPSTLMLCVTHKVTLNVVDRISTDFNSKMKEWVNKISSAFSEEINLMAAYQV